MTKNAHIAGEYAELLWDGDGQPSAHYVYGHVTPDEFRAAVDNWFAGSKRKPIVPPDAEIKHVYVRVVRAPADSEFDTEWRHTAKGRGAFPMTYWEVKPNRNAGG